MKDVSHFLVTGHTGFKGLWLSVLLISLGHRVSGLSHPMRDSDLYKRARSSVRLRREYRVDIRDYSAVIRAVEDSNPDFLVHFAAQSLVSEGYRDPQFTFETNVLGTMNVLQAAKASDSIRASVIATTDKVYAPVGQSRPFVESDVLGGVDPYSSSKAIADRYSEWMGHVSSLPLGVVRAGNVIGLGDDNQNRLIPDYVRARERQAKMIVRNPSHVRPWQHVLDCLSGYLSVLDHVSGTGATDVWNIGPGVNSQKSVADVVQVLAQLAPIDVSFSTKPSDFEEQPFLQLDCAKAARDLGWSSLLSFDEAVRWSVEEPDKSQEDLISVLRLQVEKYLSRSNLQSLAVLRHGS